MSWDFLNSESEEVKKAFSQISETEKALRKARDNYRPRLCKNDISPTPASYLYIVGKTIFE